MSVLLVFERFFPRSGNHRRSKDTDLFYFLFSVVGTYCFLDPCAPIATITVLDGLRQVGLQTKKPRRAYAAFWETCWNNEKQKTTQSSSYSFLRGSPLGNRLHTLKPPLCSSRCLLLHSTVTKIYNFPPLSWANLENLCYLVGITTATDRAAGKRSALK